MPFVLPQWRFSPRRRSFSDKQLRASIGAGLTDLEIARRFECHIVTVRRWRERFNLEGNGRGWPNKRGGHNRIANDADVLRLHSEGYSDTAIGHILRVSRTAVNQRRNKLGLHRHAYSRGRPIYDEPRRWVYL